MTATSLQCPGSPGLCVRGRSCPGCQQRPRTGWSSTWPCKVCWGQAGLCRGGSRCQQPPEPRPSSRWKLDVPHVPTERAPAPPPWVVVARPSMAMDLCWQRWCCLPGCCRAGVQSQERGALGELGWPLQLLLVPLVLLASSAPKSLSPLHCLHSARQSHSLFPSSCFPFASCFPAPKIHS